MTQPHQIDREAVALLPCPFCGSELRFRRGVNPYGHCQTEGCFANRAQTVPLDDPKQVAAWNRRPAPEAVAWREKVARIIDPSSASNSNGQTAAMRERWARATAKADAILALIATHPVQAPEAVAWRVKDYADGWILFHHEAPARKSGEARNGALVEPLYTHPVQGGEG